MFPIDLTTSSNKPMEFGPTTYPALTDDVIWHLGRELRKAGVTELSPFRGDREAIPARSYYGLEVARTVKRGIHLGSAESWERGRLYDTGAQLAIRAGRGLAGALRQGIEHHGLENLRPEAWGLPYPALVETLVDGDEAYYVVTATAQIHFDEEKGRENA